MFIPVSITSVWFQVFFHTQILEKFIYQFQIATIRMSQFLCLLLLKFRICLLNGSTHQNVLVSLCFPYYSSGFAIKTDQLRYYDPRWQWASKKNTVWYRKRKTKSREPQNNNKLFGKQEIIVMQNNFQGSHKLIQTQKGPRIFKDRQQLSNDIGNCIILLLIAYIDFFAQPL